MTDEELMAQLMDLEADRPLLLDDELELLNNLEAEAEERGLL